MNKPISLSQKSRILDFLSKNNIASEEGVWKRMDELDSGTASDIIEAFYKRNNAIAIKQLQHLKIIV